MSIPQIPPGPPGITKTQFINYKHPITMGVVADSLDAYSRLIGAVVGDPGTIPAIATLTLDFTCPLGSATWQHTVVNGRHFIAFASPGDSLGTPIDVTPGGVYKFTSGTSGVTNEAGIKASGLPGGTVTANVTVTAYACNKVAGGWRYMLQDMRYGTIAFTANRSVPGQTLHDAIIPGGLLDQAIADGPKVLNLALAINDILLASATSAILLADTITAANRVISAGIPLILSLPSPLWGNDINGVPYAGAPYAYNATQEATRVDFIRMANETFSGNPWVYIEDTNTLMTDTTKSTGQAFDGDTVDSIHFFGGGAQKRAFDMANIFEQFAPLNYLGLNRSGSANYNSSSQPGGNLLVSGQGGFVGSGGTAGTGTTGVVATGLTVSRSAGTGLTCICSKIKSIDNGSVRQRYELSGSTGLAVAGVGTTDAIRTVIGAPAIANFAIGDKVVLELDVEVMGDGLYSIYGQFFLTGITTPTVVKFEQWRSVIYGIRSGRMKVTSFPFIWQASISAVGPQIFMETLLGATVIVDLCGMNLSKVA